jgi:intracellular multiplication protein IcmO
MRNLYLRPSGRVRHESVLGRSGSGKSEYMKSRIAQQIRRGGAAVIVDAKPTEDFLDWVSSIAYCYGRWHQLRVVDLQRPDRSHTYSAIVRGDGEMVSERIANIFGAGAKRDASAEHFKQMMLNALQPTVDCIKRLGRAYNIWDLYILMTNPVAMEWLLRQTPESQEKQNYATFLQTYRTPVVDRQSGTTEWRINTQSMQQQIRGAAGRLQPYGTGNLGAIMRTYAPEVDLLDVIDTGKILYVPLPTLERGETAFAFAKLLLSDFKAAVAEIYARGQHTAPLIPAMFYGDEFGSWTIDRSEELVEKMRGANIGGMFLFQTSANLTVNGPEFAARIIGNCEMRTFLQLGDPDSCELAAKIIGEELRRFTSESEVQAQSASNRFLDVQVFHGVARSQSKSVSAAERYDYVVRPEELAGLPVGEAFFLPMAAQAVFRTRFPMVEPPLRYPYWKQSYKVEQRPGLNLDRLFERGAFMEAA